jgi:hypothetical protein
MVPGLVARFFRDTEWRESHVAGYASVGLLVFVTSFLWGASRDFMQVVYGLSFFVPVLLVLLLRKPDFKQYGGWFTALALLYGTYATASTLWSPAPRLLFFGYHLLFLAVWLCGTSWLANRGQLGIERFYNYLVAAGAISAVIYLGLFYAHYPWQDRLELHHWGVLRQPNSLGFLFGVTSLIAYLLWQRSRGWGPGFAYFGLFVVNMLPMAASQSRNALLAFIMVMVTAFILAAKSRSKLVAHLVVGFVLVALVYAQWDKVWKIVESRINAPTYREEVWPFLVETTIRDHLLFGEGLVKTSRITPPVTTHGKPFEHAHSAYVDAFYRTGLVGLILMMAHLVYVLRHWSRNPLLLPLFLWILFACLFSLFDNPGFFWYLEFMWLVYWIPAGLIGALVMAQRQKSAPA